MFLMTIASLWSTGRKPPCDGSGSVQSIVFCVTGKAFVGTRVPAVVMSELIESRSGGLHAWVSLTRV